MFDFYRGFKIQFLSQDKIYIVDYYEQDLGLLCAHLQDAKNCIDMKMKSKDWRKLEKYFVRPADGQKALPSCNFKLAPLPPAVPSAPTITWIDEWCNTKQEGITPMRYNDNYATASASVATQPSDTAVTREYLLTRLAKADRPKTQELTDLFNLYTDNSPKTYKQMIDIIKAGTYTIDPKIAKIIDASTEEDQEPVGYWGPLMGIIWPGPQSDRKGFDAASKEQQKQYTAAKDTIMVGTAAEGLAAIKAFEAWLPTVTASSNTAS